MVENKVSRTVAEEFVARHCVGDHRLHHRRQQLQPLQIGHKKNQGGIRGRQRRHHNKEKGVGDPRSPWPEMGVVEFVGGGGHRSRTLRWVRVRIPPPRPHPSVNLKRKGGRSPVVMWFQWVSGVRGRGCHSATDRWARRELGPHVSVLGGMWCT